MPSTSTGTKREFATTFINLCKEPPTKRLSTLARQHLEKLNLKSKNEASLYADVIEFISHAVFDELQNPKTSDGARSETDENDDSSSTYSESNSAKRCLIETFECLVCKNVPRPRSFQVPYVTCNDEHIVCTPCANKLKHKRCPGCNIEIEFWQMPTCTNRTVRNLYQETTKLIVYECLRACGKVESGYDDIKQHDKGCQYGRGMYCPFDDKPIVPYNHNINRHDFHLRANSPIQYHPRKWSFVFDWENVLDRRIPGQILYMESEHNHYDREQDGSLDPYSPRAALVTFKIVSCERRICHENGQTKKVITCKLKVNWMETPPIESEKSPEYFFVNEIKPHREMTACRIQPTYQTRRPHDSTARKILEQQEDEEERRFLQDQENDPSPKRMSFYFNNDTYMSMFNPCSTCGVYNQNHTHFNFTLGINHIL